MVFAVNHDEPTNCNFNCQSTVLFKLATLLRIAMIVFCL